MLLLSPQPEPAGMEAALRSLKSGRGFTGQDGEEQWHPRATVQTPRLNSPHDLAEIVSSPRGNGGPGSSDLPLKASI